MKSLIQFITENEDPIKKWHSGAVVNSLRTNSNQGSYHFQDVTHVKYSQNGQLSSWDQHPSFDVHHDNKKIGNVMIIEHHKQKHVETWPLIDENHRRKGHSTNIHNIISNIAKAVGKIHKKPDDADLTPDGKAFWKKKLRP